MLKKMLMIGGLVVVVAGAGVGGLLVGRGQASGTAEHATAEDEEIVADATGGHGEEAGDKAGTEEGHGAAKGGHGAEASATGGQEPVDLGYEMREITTNLNDPTGRQFVRIRIQLEASTPEARAQIEKNQAPLRDAALFLLSGKSPEDIQLPAGKERLKRELLARFNGLLEPNAVREVYILDSIVQRI
ncbi:MAG: flagellar basal body-associated protein FliL [candidate division BRC1 bacterium ADurb.BinA292]|nr:MAG: flagellar basal body-associated protein FliL [candidate division BRC1 bacterium ADurb.BinA292]